MRQLVAPMALGAALSLIAACGGDPKPVLSSPPSTPTSSAPSTSSASPSTASGPPVMPEAARQHTKAGAIAFVKYYWDVVNYAQRTLDTTALVRLADRQCSTCRGGPEFISDVRRKHGVIHGGRDVVTEETALPISVAGDAWMEVRFHVTANRQVVEYPGRRNEVYAGGATNGQIALQPIARGWRVNMIGLNDS